MWPHLCIKRSKSQWTRLAQCYPKAPAKLSLVLQGYNAKKIRCGVILPRDEGRLRTGSAFLSALLADVYSPDQVWFNVWRKRYLQKDRSPSTILVKYGSTFDKRYGEMAGEELTVFSLPSPLLERYRVEFVEMQSTDLEDEDGCHFYISLQDQNDMSYVTADYHWPTVYFQLVSNLRKMPLPMGNQLDPEWALGATCRFINNKNAVDDYLNAMQRSNFNTIKSKLERKLQDVGGILRDLEVKVLDNIARRENLHERHRNLILGKRKTLKKIDEWNENAHTELQFKIIPQLQKFVKTQLSVWKVYTYSESKLQLNLLKMITEPLCNLRMVNSLNRLKGELEIDGDISKGREFVNTGEISREAADLHKNINRIVYQNFLLLQLPLILVATFGMVTGECSAFSMGALASFGIVLGFSRVLAIWQSLLETYVKKIRETLISSIENEKLRLIEEYESDVATREKDLETKYKIFESLINGGKG